jgi:hypothetical protein
LHRAAVVPERRTVRRDIATSPTRKRRDANEKDSDNPFDLHLYLPQWSLQLMFQTMETDLMLFTFCHQFLGFDMRDAPLKVLAFGIREPVRPADAYNGFPPFKFVTPASQGRTSF